MVRVELNEPLVNIEELRNYFPALNQYVQDHPYVYLDNAATTQKPESVIQTVERYYRKYNSNIHRGIHTLAEEATKGYEDARVKVKDFINAKETEEVIFTKGTTESINLVASSYGRKYLNEGDEVIISNMEHHSNIVPWQLICEERGAILKVIPVTDRGELDLDAFYNLLTDRTKIVSVVFASNSLGTINPAHTIIEKAHEAGAVVLIDGAQAAPHLELDVQLLDCDFLAFSGHKMYGPTGVGVLYGKRALLEEMPPYQGGGEMIKEVSFDGTTFNDLPYKFEAGTPNIAGVIGLGEAIDFISRIGKDSIKLHEENLLKTVTEEFKNLDKITLYGTAPEKVSVLSFTVDGAHHFDLAMLLDSKGIAVRTGHHCTMPLMERYGIEGTVRASFAAYNTLDDIDRLVEAVKGILYRKR